jgi:hypothetical protein
MVTVKKQTRDLITDIPFQEQKTFVIIECSLTSCDVRQKATFTKIEATDYTGALLKFKSMRKLKDLPFHTMIIPESVINYYPQGM